MLKDYDEFRNSLSISPADGEKITGIPAENIIELAHIIASGGPVTIIPGLWTAKASKRRADYQINSFTLCTYRQYRKTRRRIQLCKSAELYL